MGSRAAAPDYTVMVAADKFDKDSPDQESLQKYHDPKVRLPTDRTLWPDLRHIGWHRKNRSQGA